MKTDSFVVGVFVCFLAFFPLARSSSGQTTAGDEWTWIGGSKSGDQTITYGTLGTPSSTANPGSREGSLTWTDVQGNLWLFGGYALGDASNNYSDGGYSDLWRFDASTEEWTWVAGPNAPQQPGIYGTLGTEAAANRPGARSGAVGWTDTSGNLWLFGGEGVDAAGNSGYLNDLWKFNASTSQWSWMGGGSVLPSCPSTNSCGPQGVYGTQGTPSASNLPGGRSGALSWVDSSGNFWLFGGSIYTVYVDGWEGYENDLWMFNPKTSEWTWMGGSRALPASCTLNDSCGQPGVYGQQQSPSTANAPGAREDSFAWTDKAGNLWLFGGFGFDSTDTRGELNDLWEFNPGTKEWAWVAGSSTVGSAYGGASGTYGLWQTPGAGNTPGGRDSGAGWKDANGNLWLFGGYGYDASGSEGQLNDLWEFNPTTSRWAWISGSGSVDQFGNYGTLGVPSPQDGPGGRSKSTSWMDTAGNFWLFGGSGYDASGANEPLDDLWEFQPYASNDPVTTEPSFSPGGGTYTSVQTVTLSDTTPNATIYYRIGSSSPPVEYTAPITVLSSETIQAIAVATGYTNSAAVAAAYTLNLPAPPAPTFSPAPGTYYGIQAVSITDAELYATIYYTTDGTTPTVQSKVYNGNFQVASSETIQAIAVVSGGVISTIASGKYTILPVPPNTWAWVRGDPFVIDQPGAYSEVGLALSQNLPGSRTASASWTDDNGNFWLFGGSGFDASGNQGALNDLWEYQPGAQIQDGQWIWVSGSNTIPCTTTQNTTLCTGQPGVYGTQGQSAAGNTPGGRMGAVTWVDGSGNLWLFGGLGGTLQIYAGSHGDETYFNDLWKFNPSTNQWTWISGSSTGNSAGVNGTMGSPSPANVPSGRYGAVGWVDHSGNLWMFGGYGSVNGYVSEGISQVQWVLNDLWMFNPSTSQWAWMGGSSTFTCYEQTVQCYPPSGVYGTMGTQDSANMPGARAYATAWTDTSGNFWLFGGSGYDSQGNWGEPNDLWELNPTTNQWTWINGSNTVPCGYNVPEGVTLCTNPPAVRGTLGVPASTNTPPGGLVAANWMDKQGNFWVFGSLDNFDVTGEFEGASSDVWVYIPTTNQWAWMGGDSATSNCAWTNDVGEAESGGPDYECQGSQGVTGPDYLPAIGSLPPSRAGAVGWTDTKGNFWLFSGEANQMVNFNYYLQFGDFNDFWEFQPSAATLPPASSPVFSLLPGSYFSGGPLAMSNGMANASIYYTTDGSAPTTSSTLYSGPIQVLSSETVQAMATAPGYINSSVTSATYTFLTTPPPPTYSLAPGSYNSSQTLTLSDANQRAVIFYTTDGSQPDSSLIDEYTGPITISSSETVNAIASQRGITVVGNIASNFTTGLLQSSVASATYTINLPPPSFTVTGTGVTVNPGSTTGNTSTITITPSGGFTGNVALIAKVTSSPSGAQNPPTLSFGSTSPVKITGSGAGTAILTISTTAATSAALTRPRSFGSPWYASGDVVLACILLLGIPARRQSWQRMLGLLALLIALASAISACGGGGGAGGAGGGGSGIPGTTAGIYTVTVSATSGTIAETGTVKLTVQ